MDPYFDNIPSNYSYSPGDTVPPSPVIITPAEIGLDVFLGESLGDYLGRMRSKFPQNDNTTGSSGSSPTTLPVLAPGVSNLTGLRMNSRRAYSNQNVMLNFNPEREAIGVVVSLLTGYEMDAPKFASLTNVFVSPEYTTNFICEEALTVFDIPFDRDNIKEQPNPRGGRFRPIGAVRLYMKFEGQDDRQAWFINALVLPGSLRDAQANLGVTFIIGRQDIQRILGWSPGSQHLF